MAAAAAVLIKEMSPGYHDGGGGRGIPHSQGRGSGKAHGWSSQRTFRGPASVGRGRTHQAGGTAISSFSPFLAKLLTRFNEHDAFFFSGC